MWDLGGGEKADPWRADDYLFGIWDLLTGKEEEVCRFMRYYHGLAKKTEREI